MYKYFLLIILLFGVVSFANALKIEINGADANGTYTFDTSSNSSILVELVDRFSSEYRNLGKRINITQKDYLGESTVGTGIISSELYGDFYVDGKIEFIKDTTSNVGCSPDISYTISGSLISPYWGHFVIGTSSYYCPKINKASIDLSSQQLGNINLVNTDSLFSLNIKNSRGVETTINSSDIFDNRGVSVNGQISLGGLSGLESELTTKNYWVNKNVATNGKMLNFNKIIGKNLVKYTKGLTASNSTTLNLFSDKVHYYNFEGDPATPINYNNGRILRVNEISYKMGVSGQKLLYVKGGNVYIDADIVNNTSNSQLVIVVKRDSTNNQNGGNIYIDPKVTNIDAVLIADGSIMSYDGSNVLNAINNTNDLRKQLLIYGSISSKNTFGDDTAKYGTDDYINNGGSEVANILTYNLSNLRSFQAILNDDIEGLCSGSNELVARGNTGTGALQYAFAGKKECSIDDAIQSGLRSTEKLAGLVIEYNPVIQIDPHFILKND